MPADPHQHAERECLSCGAMGHWYLHCPVQPFGLMLADALGVNAPGRAFPGSLHMNETVKAQLIGAIGAAIDQRILPLFRNGEEAKVTVLVRFPGQPDADVIVTSDDDLGIRAIVERRTAVKTFLVQIKTKKQIRAEIPADQHTWVRDVAAGDTLTVRDATADDLARCSLSESLSHNPADWYCEAIPRGALVDKRCVAKVWSSQ